MSRQNPKAVALVPARGGSKGIPYKNIKDFGGKPLIYWTLSALSRSEVDGIYVSTDCDRIREVVEGLHVPKVKVIDRSPETATDEASTEECLLEFVEDMYDQHSLEMDDTVVLAQATSPFTTAKDVNRALEVFYNPANNTGGITPIKLPVVSVVPFYRFLWSSDGKPVNYDYKNRPRRQDIDSPLYLENGALYVNSVQSIRQSRSRIGLFYGDSVPEGREVSYCVMPEHTAIELDTELDWQLAESIFNARA